MKTQSAFETGLKKQFTTLDQYVPVVDRVHGSSHPEFHTVRALYDEIRQKIKGAGSGRPELLEEFAKLREITGNYTVPGDVCESYEAVYELLAEIDAAYHG